MRNLSIIGLILLTAFIVSAVTSDVNAASLAAWGQGKVPIGNDFADIAAGYYHCLVLRSDGSLVAWGNNDDGQCNVPVGTGFETVAAGGWHSAALKSDGSLVAWGRNNYGQCNVSASTNVLAIAAGYNFNVAIVYIIPGDFDANRQVNFVDFTTFASRWMDTGCNYSNNWCGQTDLDKLGTVDMIDLRIFLQHWIEGPE